MDAVRLFGLHSEQVEDHNVALLYSYARIIDSEYEKEDNGKIRKATKGVLDDAAKGENTTLPEVP